MIRAAFPMFILAFGGPDDDRLRRLTFVFGRRNALNPVFQPLAAKSGPNERMFRSEFDGVFYGVSRQATDGEGHTVADTQRTRRPDWIL